jgi:hypothetical protein
LILIYVLLTVLRYLFLFILSVCRFGQTINTCSGKCKKGYYCPKGSTSPEQIPCPAGRYGSTEGLKNADCTGPAALGHYTTLNSTSPIEFLCPAGRYGGVVGLINDGCSSTSATADSLEIGFEQANSGCLSVSHGIGNGGLVGHTKMGRGDGDLTSISTSCGDTFIAYCSPGYWCPPGSTVPTQRRCGNSSVYCPMGSKAPTLAPPGYYTILGLPITGEHRLNQGGDGNGVDGDSRRKGPNDMGGTSELEAQTRSDIAICPTGYYCRRGVRKPCPRGTYGSTTGLSTRECSGLAALGHWTREASTSPTQYKCSPGKYADREGSTSSSCTGSCDHGFYCTSGSISRRQNKCGHRGVYCPIGSKKPTRSSRGYYTVPEDPQAKPEGWASERRGQVICSP